MRYHIRHKIVVHVQVVVNHLVAHSDDAGPRDMIVAPLKIDRYVLRRLSHSLDQMSQSQTQRFIGLERVARAPA